MKGQALQYGSSNVWIGAAVAILAILAGVAAHVLLAPVVGDRVAFLVFVPAVVLASAHSGLAPGALAAMLGVWCGLFLAQRHGPVAIVMGCTEIPLGLQGAARVEGLDLLDPARVLAAALASRAYRGSARLPS